MPDNHNKGKGPYADDWPEAVSRDGVKLIHGKCEPLYEFDLREFHGMHSGMPVAAPEPMRPQKPRGR